ncbi:MAG: 2,3-bisphosphoglycerate-independent phosphoglycerate mutase [bacterium]|nr:2,3-bisphosphoglycerate-independent phosphoglycerate mutase [bacterium]
MITSPIVLAILDGWGLTRNTRGNAIYDAYTPSIDHIAAWHPSLVLQASGFSVGMVWGEPGNSEAGHTAIGTGRILYHHLPRILKEIRSENFFENSVLLGAIAHAKNNRGKLHLVGIVSGASVHSYLDHLYALFELAKRNDIPALLHVITDGKDAPPRQGMRILEEVLARISAQQFPVIPASVMGRHFLIDDTRTSDRIFAGYQALTNGTGAVEVPDALNWLNAAYEKGVTDEFVSPAILKQNTRIQQNDAVICFNFREDGLRQFVRLLAAQGGIPDNQPPPPQNIYLATFTRYDPDLPAGVAFPAPDVRDSLSEMLSKHGVQQLKIAESRKIAHVSYFFNGGREEPFPFEHRVIIPSASEGTAEIYAGAQASAVSDEVVRAIDRTAAECIVVNFADADAAAHTGNYRSTIRAIEAVDQAIGSIYQAVVHRKGALLITADHGGAEDMFNIRTGEVKTGHSDNPVPLYYVTSRNRFRAMRDEEELRKRYTQPTGVLADIAPTILELLGVKKPAEMTGRSLLELL